jgi:hypothetical protein
VVAAARANPDMGPAHAETTKYAAALAGWEAGELRFNHGSPWACGTNKGRAIYWRNGPFQTTLEAPAEGVNNLAEVPDEDWSKLQRRQALLLQPSPKQSNMISPNARQPPRLRRGASCCC